jgi:UDP-N-acetylmuramate dehydrogenase
VALIENEPLSKHTTFKIGGNADFYARPDGSDFAKETARIIGDVNSRRMRQELPPSLPPLPLFVLGAGSNVVFADEGFRGLVLDTGGWAGIAVDDFAATAGAATDADEVILNIRSGTLCDDAAVFAAERGLSGFEFMAGLPGSIGGAIFMNARCYGRSVSDSLVSVEFVKLSELTKDNFDITVLPYKDADYGYKKSPFQCQSVLILCARFRLKRGDKNKIKAEMEDHRRDRQSKGHFSYPSAGSVFKNDHKAGRPSGKIIEELGLRGTQIGGAKIADWHGNFNINTGGASAKDVASLVALVKESARKNAALELESEIIFVGEN